MSGIPSLGRNKENSILGILQEGSEKFGSFMIVLEMQFRWAQVKNVID